jgi:hypothetical protein
MRQVQGAGNSSGDVLSGADGSQRHPDHPIRKGRVLCQVCSDLEGQAGLADATRPQQCQQTTGGVGQAGAQVGKLGGASNQGRGRWGQTQGRRGWCWQNGRIADLFIQPGGFWRRLDAQFSVQHAAAGGILRQIALMHRHWSGKHRRVVNGINLVSLVWRDDPYAVPCDYRLFDAPNDGLTKNDHFRAMLQTAKDRGFTP